MDTVQTLGATSTVGVAAVGFALGKSPYHTSQTISRKRTKTPLDRTSRISGDFSAAAFLPTESVQPPSRPSSRLGFLRRPHTSSYPSQHYPSFDTANEKGGWNFHTSDRDDDFITVNNGPHDFHNIGSDTTRSSWLRRMSTFSSSRNGSPTNTPRPSTPSMSFSNASSAPILPTASIAGPIAPRNKLVKRMSSQGPLRGSPNSLASSKSKVPTLRRPATSHQRSATLLQQFEEEEMSTSHSPMTIPEIETLEDDFSSAIDASQTWIPYFEPQRSMPVKEIPTKRKSSPERQSHLDTPRRISAARDSSPTLLMATSIHPQPRKRSPYNTNGRSTIKTSDPITPNRLSSSTSHIPPAAQGEPQSDPGHRERNSFSIADLMPSPSPSTWKLARSGSSRGRKGLNVDAIGRRVASAPQSTKKKPLHSSSPHGESSTRKRSTETGLKSSTNPHLTPSKSPISAKSTGSSNKFLSSPLPALEGLSTFDIDIPGFNTSFPNTPQPSSNTSTFSSFPLTANAAPDLSRPATRGQSRAMSQPSGNHSDRASTIMESDNENSRVFDDANEPESRSETIYDSIRTGASVSSHSGIKGSRIENLFDEKGSVHPELLSKNLAALQDNLAKESLSNSRLQHDRISEEEESIGTPVKHSAVTAPVNANLHSPAMSNVSTSPELSSSPPTVFAGLNQYPNDLASLDDSHDHNKLDVDDFDDDVCWDEEILQEENIKQHQPPIAPLPTLMPRMASLNLSNALHGRTNRPNSKINDGRGHSMETYDYSEHDASKKEHGKVEANGIHGLSLDERPKSNIFDWSEQSSFERSTQAKTSPRPNTVHGKQGQRHERGSRATGRRPPSALHLRSQSVPLSPEVPRGVTTASQLDAWLLGNKGASEEWDDDFTFDELTTTTRPHSEGHIVEGLAGGSMFVPKAIMERQSAVQGQFGQVKELTMLVDELKRLRIQGAAHNLLNGKSAELWTEAEGIVNLATLDNENEELLPPRSPTSASFDVDPFDDVFDHPAPASPPKGSSPSLTRPRKESVATAKSVLENIHQARSSMDPPLESRAHSTQPKKLPFDTTSLRDLVTRAGVVTRALKEIVRKADENWGEEETTGARAVRADPEFSKIFD